MKLNANDTTFPDTLLFNVKLNTKSRASCIQNSVKIRKTAFFIVFF